VTDVEIQIGAGDTLDSTPAVDASLVEHEAPKPAGEGAPAAPPREPDTVPQPAAPRRDPLVGRIIAGRYEVLEQVGVGGMGAVYRAYQAAMDREVALKVLSASLAADEHSVKRFHQEAKAASKLRHPNTITLHDFGQSEDGILFIAMEFLEGSPLDGVIRRDHHVTPERAIKIMAQVCRSLHEAHHVGIVHRDLKPDNVYLTEVGGEHDFVKVLDFGVAKLREANKDAGTLTQAGMIFGTPRYMSPEQSQSLPLDGRSDLYAMGVILYELLTGHPPFDADSPLSILIQHVHEAPPRMDSWQDAPKVNASLEKVVFRLLEKDPARRPASALDLLAELAEVLREIQPSAASGPQETGIAGVTEAVLSTDSAFPMPKLPAQREPGDEEDTTPRGAVAAAAPRIEAKDGPTTSDQWAFAVSEPPAHAARREKSPAPLIAAGVIGALLLGLVLWFALGRGPTPEPEAPAVVSPTPVEPAPVAATAAVAAAQPPVADAGVVAKEPAPAKPPVEAKKPPVAGKAPPKRQVKRAAPKVTVTLTSIPPGAEVYAPGGAFVGLTPVPVQKQQSKQAVRFKLKKKGFKEATALVLLDKSRRVTTKLSKAGPSSDDAPLLPTPRAPKPGESGTFKPFGD